ncbi:MAG TPA: YceI family protein, partial [Segetibacter sp.]|jgi:polyisoprenoid-binding protein YceI
MKTELKFISSVLTFSLLLLQACSDTPKGDKATINEEQKASEATGQTFTVDTTTSRIRFTGNGVGKNHPGVFRLSSGTVSIANNQVTGGDFVINIKSMEMEEEGDMFQNKLKPHLLSGDFFDADKFGTGKFKITKVEPYSSEGKDTSIVAGANFSVSGNLTLKETTKNITFPAKIDLDGMTLKAKGNFNIDRTQWKMNYGNDKTLGDKFISETVNIEIDLEARRQ